MIANPTDVRLMSRAIHLAMQGQGSVEPNPMVGSVIAIQDQIISEGWHQTFGGPHAEVNAINNARQELSGATIYVSLEPCCHHGKTPPCSDAIIRSGISRVVVAQEDPNPQVAGQGIAQLREAGIQVEVGVCETEARHQIAPFRKRIETGRPWIIAKWAMTLDGKIATRSGHSQWISSQAAREIVHALRGRVDGVVVGSGTAVADNPSLTARPPGVREAARIVVDSRASLATDSQLVRTATDTPVLVAVGQQGSRSQKDKLRAAGCRFIECAGSNHLERLDSLLLQLGDQSMTNLLVEGGGKLLGNFLQLGQIDEVHVFVAPKIAGGADAITPIQGLGVATMDDALDLDAPRIQVVGSDVYISGRVDKQT